MTSKLTPPPTPEEIATANRIIDRHQIAHQISHSNALLAPLPWALDAIIDILRTSNNLGHMSELYGQLFEIDQNLDRLCESAGLPPETGSDMPKWYSDAAAMIVGFEERRRHIATLERVAGSAPSPEITHRYCKVERCVSLAYSAVTMLGYQGEPITDTELHALNTRLVDTPAFAELGNVVQSMEAELQAKTIAETLSATLGEAVSVQVVQLAEIPTTTDHDKESGNGSIH